MECLDFIDKFDRISLVEGWNETQRIECLGRVDRMKLKRRPNFEQIKGKFRSNVPAKIFNELYMNECPSPHIIRTSSHWQYDISKSSRIKEENLKFNSGSNYTNRISNNFQLSNWKREFHWIFCYVRSRFQVCCSIIKTKSKARSRTGLNSGTMCAWDRTNDGWKVKEQQQPGDGSYRKLKSQIDNRQ